MLDASDRPRLAAVGLLLACQRKYRTHGRERLAVYIAINFFPTLDGSQLVIYTEQTHNVCVQLDFGQGISASIAPILDAYSPRICL